MKPRRPPKLSEILWTAQRHGHDWRDVDCERAIAWLTSFVKSDEWHKRMDSVHSKFQAAKADWANGDRTPLFDPADLMAWYVYQAQRYADPALRPDFFIPQGYRLAPIFRRLGQLVPVLDEVQGVAERVARLMTHGKTQPDDGIYELLVAAAYKTRGWKRVAFVPETPGVKKQPDLFVERGRSSWAAECKRAGRSGYLRDELAAAETMSSKVHKVSRSAGRSLRMIVRFDAELTALDSDYLEKHAQRFVDGSEGFEWEDEGGKGIVMDVDWRPLRHCLKTDDIYFGSSRMIELLLKRYDDFLDYDVAGEWLPARGRPLHATSVDHVSLVGWRSVSAASVHRKAQHFRSVVGRAADQLPGDRPGVIHVGYEATAGNTQDGRRHFSNRLEMLTFDPQESRLRWVCANYMMAEHVTSKDESAAISETTAWYPIGRTKTPEPLKGHLLFDDGIGRPGSHFSF